MINNEIKKILDEQQSEIINDNNKYLCVSACPGAGKTYTLIKKMKNELETLKEYQGIIACSFTKAASNEIKNRLNIVDNKLNNCFIGTIDSLIMNLIIFPFLNRYLFYSGKITKRVAIKSITIENKKEINNYVRNYDKYDGVMRQANNYIEEWYNDLKNGIYRISFPAYMLAKKIVEFNLFNQYFSIRFPTIYIDEAQDLNFFQHQFLKALKEKTNINIVLFGDPNQSIYQFRGARPEFFNELSKNDYKIKKITVSVRCHPSILYYANKIFDPNTPITFKESHVKVISEINLDFLKSINGGIYLLVESNATAIELYEKYKNDFDILYSKKLDNMPNDYEINQEIIDELIKYYINYDNINDKYKYPVDELIKILSFTNNKIRKQDLNLNKLSLSEFLIKTKNILNIDICENTISIIQNKLLDEKYKYYYYVSDKKNKIMTIHTSKGLESKNVIIYLDSTFQLKDDFKNKLFVGITRAKDNVYIYYTDYFIGKDYINMLVNK